MPGIATVESAGEELTRLRQLEKDLNLLRRALEDRNLGLLTEVPETSDPELRELIALAAGEQAVATNEDLEHLSDGVLRLNEHNQIVYANQAVVEVLGGDNAGEFVLSLFSDLFGGDVSLSQHQPQQVVLRQRGEEKTLEFVPNQARKGYQIVLVRDVTRKLALEAELKRSRDKALELAQSKADFLANMSHEIRTPMNGVIGMTDALLDTKLDAEQTDLAMLIKSSGAALLTIINDILDFSKLEAGRIVLEFVPVKIRSLAREVIELLRAKAMENVVELSLSVDQDVPETVMCDPTRVRQILLNLVGNAVKFTHEGKVSLTISAEPTSAGSWITISVADTGIGIPPDQLENIFGKFTQAETSTTRRFGGTGLGLAISRQLAELMLGSLTASSRGPGAGSLFLLQIPARRPSEEEAMPSRPNATSFRPLSENLRVLLAEDNLTNQKVALRVLTKLGCVVTVANNGGEATALYESSQFDVILMDCMMPEVDGFEATRAIRDLEKSRSTHTPIIALTANAMQGDRERCLEAGMDDYLTKPFKQQALEKALSRWTWTDTRKA